MEYKIVWDQWYRSGPYGDEHDYRVESIVVTDLEAAQEFKRYLVEGTRTSQGWRFTDCKVDPDDISIVPIVI